MKRENINKANEIHRALGVRENDLEALKTATTDKITIWVGDRKIPVPEQVLVVVRVLAEIQAKESIELLKTELEAL